MLLSGFVFEKIVVRETLLVVVVSPSPWLLCFSTYVFVAGHHRRCCLFFDRTCLSVHHVHTDEWRFVVSSSPRKCLHILCMLPRTLCLIAGVSVRDPWLGRMSGRSLVVWRRIERLGLDKSIRLNVGSSFSLDRFVRRWMELRRTTVVSHIRPRVSLTLRCFCLGIWLSRYRWARRRSQTASHSSDCNTGPHPTQCRVGSK